MQAKKIFKKTDKIVTRDIEGEVILLPLYKSSKDMNYIYTLNETAAAFWNLVDGKKTVSAIAKEILAIYDVSEEILAKEIDALVKDLKSIKAII
ncbi:MAG: PqqD family protein [Candidatus Omnitrophica bacterium]|nr:PqqD family protein [Candidatus Omnitrophota bacterium]